MVFNYLGDFREPAPPAFLPSSQEHTVWFLLTVLHIIDTNEVYSLLQLKRVPLSPYQSHSGTQSQTCQSWVGKRPVSRRGICPC